MRTFLSLILVTLISISSVYSQTAYARVILPDVPETLDFAGERVPLENYDTRESLQREMLVTFYMHSRTFLTLLNTKRYFPIIEPILEKNGVPNDFKYLCMAESGLIPDAVSSAGAAGLWQIMPATGKEYGLVTGGDIDERYDIEKSTEAACKHLLDSYARFKSWTLAAAAYNAGNAGVNRRITKQGVKDYYDAYLPQETMRYVFRVLSFKILCADPYMYGYMIGTDDYYPPFTDYRVIDVRDEHIDWSKVAAANGTNYKILRQLNPWIRDYEYTNKAKKTFKVRIPNSGFRTTPPVSRQ